jgi:hypothetical protein
MKDSIHKILVVTSCTKDKKYPSGFIPDRQLEAEDLWDYSYDERWTRDFGELEQYRVSAAMLYRGRQHLLLMEGVNMLRRTFGDHCVDLKIISAGFGLVDEHQPLPPYNITFAGLSATKIRSIAQQLGIPQALNLLLQQRYDCAFFLLGMEYLASIHLPFATEFSFPCVFLASQAARKWMPASFPYVYIDAGQDMAISFGSASISFKGLLFKHFAAQIVANAESSSEKSKNKLIDQFFQHPSAHAFFAMLSSYHKEVDLS